jgi:hypothetical protein
VDLYGDGVATGAGVIEGARPTLSFHTALHPLTSAPHAAITTTR